MNRRQALVGVVSCGVLVTWPKLAAAQKKPKGDKKEKGQGKDKQNELRLEGTVKQVSADGLLVADEEGNRYLIGFVAASDVSVEGAATKGFLGAGAYVEFEVELDRAGKSTGPVPALTFVGTSAKDPPGVFPTAPSNSGKASVEQGKATYLVRGKMIQPRDGMLVVQTGQKTVSTYVSADATLSARLGNWMLASMGDEVKGTVEVLPQPNTGVTRVVAMRLRIRAAEPLQPPKK